MNTQAVPNNNVILIETVDSQPNIIEDCSFKKNKLKIQISIGISCRQLLQALFSRTLPQYEQLSPKSRTEFETDSKKIILEV